MKKSIKKFFVIGVISAIIMNQSIMPAMASCKTSVVSDIKGSYTWATAETCVFVYFQSPTISGAWNLKGQYSKASVAVGVSVPTLKVKGKKAIAKVLQKSYNKTVTPQNYNST